MSRQGLISVAILFGGVLFGIVGCDNSNKQAQQEPPSVEVSASQNQPTLQSEVVLNNANIAYAVYSDALLEAKNLQNALRNLVEQPSEQTLSDAKTAWLAAREPYGQSEVYRFRGGPIDVLREDGTFGEDGEGLEGRINAWPLGEALIDYIAPSIDGDAGPESPANAVGGNMISNIEDIPTIDKNVLADYFEHGEDERNVTTGYHAIEFLLWGQDLNADLSDGAIRDNSPGQRPVSDYFAKTQNEQNLCTSGASSAAQVICQRRGDYLLAAAELLVEDLQRIAQAWNPDSGEHFAEYVAAPQDSMSKMLESMGRLSFGELAGERINIALKTDSQEDEHSCFSDNTHRDIYLNAKGIENTYLGKYVRSNGEEIQGVSIHQLLIALGEEKLATQMQSKLEQTMQAASAIDQKAKNGQPFDVLIQEGVNQPEISLMISNLVIQTDVLERIIQTLDLSTGELRQDTEEEIGI